NHHAAVNASHNEQNPAKQFAGFFVVGLLLQQAMSCPRRRASTKLGVIPDNRFAISGMTQRVRG
ncbi:MAG TPA: hypothetical protein VHB73_07285, partial [Alphaproteobacteria bacterium]|nr:hypothetical protein [Alphaproteobacteria bacterium]